MSGTQNLSRERETRVMGNLKLCFIEGRIAYFTTAPLVGPGRQWGDDHDDAPYEHNAGTPYTWSERSGVPQYEIMVGMFTGPLLDPAGYCNDTNSSWSVEDINQGNVPWLKSDPLDNELFGSPSVNIYAGVSPIEFAELVYVVGGCLWVPLKPPVTQPTAGWLREY